MPISMFRSLLIAAGIATLSFAPAAAQTTMNVGWATPLDSSNGIFASKFAERLQELTDGEIEVRLRPSAQIATEDDAMTAMQLGTVDSYLVSVNNISPHFELMDVFVLPYVFRTKDHALNVIDGEVGKYLRDKLFAQTGIHLLTFNNISSRDFYNTRRPINEMSDFSGLKVRVPQNEVMLATFRAFGAEPVPMAWSETPTALQTGTIDGADNGTSVILEMKFYEFAQNLVVLDHFIGFTPFLVSDRFLSRIGPEKEKKVRQAALEAQEYQREVMDAKLEEIYADLERFGMKITRPERAEFIAAANTVQDNFAAQRGDEFADILQRIREVAD